MANSSERVRRVSILDIVFRRAVTRPESLLSFPLCDSNSPPLSCALNLATRDEDEAFLVGLPDGTRVEGWATAE